LQNNVNYLITPTSKLSIGTANLNAILGFQNCAFEKAGIGNQCDFKGKQKKFSSFFKSNEQQFSPFMTCFYYLRKSHFVRNYVKLENLMYLRGLLGGCLKASLTHVDPNLIGYHILKLNRFCRYVWHPRSSCGISTMDAPNT